MCQKYYIKKFILNKISKDKDYDVWKKKSSCDFFFFEY